MNTNTVYQHMSTLDIQLDVWRDHHSDTRSITVFGALISRHYHGVIHEVGYFTITREDLWKWAAV